MKTNEQKAFDFAADTTKQLITLSTAIIALTITFSKDIIGASNITNSSSIFWAWGFFIASVIFGIWTLMALTGTLQPMDKKIKNKEKTKTESEKTEEELTNINGFNIKFPAILQILTFIAALIFTANFGMNSICASNDKTNSNIENHTEMKEQNKLMKPIRNEYTISN